jgi:hypothetical protein
MAKSSLSIGGAPIQTAGIRKRLLSGVRVIREKDEQSLFSGHPDVRFIHRRSAIAAKMCVREERSV